MIVKDVEFEIGNFTTVLCFVPSKVTIHHQIQSALTLSDKISQVRARQTLFVQTEYAECQTRLLKHIL